MQLSPHFNLEELIESREARVYGIDNTPDEAVIERLKYTASQLEHVRLVLGAPLIITSGYRCPALNCVTGGAMTKESLEKLVNNFPGKEVVRQAYLRLSEHRYNAADSQHMRGEAVDCISPRFGSPIAVCRAVEASDVRFDQLIYEYGGWMHISFVADRKPRRQVLTYQRGVNGPLAGIVG